MKDLKCPITGVYIPRFLLSIVSGFAFIYVYDFILHGRLLMGLYEQTPDLWRPVEEMKMDWMIGKQVLLALITALIFTRNYEAKGIGEGVRYGVMLGALMAVMMGCAYAWMPISLNLALAWMAGGFVQGLGLGVVFALTYRECKNCK